MGQLTGDSQLPTGCELREQRLDDTEVGEGNAVTFIDATADAQVVRSVSAEDVARRLGLADKVAGLVRWDVFEAVLTPGQVILMLVWTDRRTSRVIEETVPSTDQRRVRDVRIIRDYGMLDRREAPQYYPPSADRR